MYQLTQKPIYYYSSYSESWKEIIGFNLLTGAFVFKTVWVSQEEDVLNDEIQENPYMKLKKNFLSTKIIPRNPKGYLHREYKDFLNKISSTSTEAYNELRNCGVTYDKFQFS